METTTPHSVRELVSSFSPDERKMLMLHWSEEMTPREIEMVLGLPEDAVFRTLSEILALVEQAIHKCPTNRSRRNRNATPSFRR